MCLTLNKCCAPLLSSFLFFIYELNVGVFILNQISIQKCDQDGDNRLRVCRSACQSYNKACGASLDCLDQTLFNNENEEGLCTGYGSLDQGYSVF